MVVYSPETGTKAQTCGKLQILSEGIRSRGVRSYLVARLWMTRGSWSKGLHLAGLALCCQPVPVLHCMHPSCQKMPYETMFCPPGPGEWAPATGPFLRRRHVPLLTRLFCAAACPDRARLPSPGR